MIAWFNADLLPLGGISIPATDRGFLLGDGFYETIACNSGQPVRFQKHMQRLHKTAKLMKIDLPHSLDEIQSAINDVLTGCQLMKSRASIRITVTRGSGPRGLRIPLKITPNVMITAAKVPDCYEAAKIKTVSIVRNEHTPSAHIKSLSYIDNIFAFEEAEAAGFDEALLLNTKGHIAEGSISNIFFIKNDCLFTPPIEDGALPGIMREAVLKKAQALGLKTKEASLTPDIALTCDEVFLTNSLVRVRSVKQIDDRLIASQKHSNKLLHALIDDE